jgi:deazaflavin-dependent oxidoreductase (nitroreductase family)
MENDHMSPLGRRMARFNSRVTNHLMRPLATWAPGFGVVVHTGRRSGRTYRTPVNVFARGGGYVIALTYGADSDWVKNVTAAGRCELVTRRRRVPATRPEIFHDEHRREVSALARPMLRLLDVTAFMRLSVAGAGG